MNRSDYSNFSAELYDLLTIPAGRFVVALYAVNIRSLSNINRLYGYQFADLMINQLEKNLLNLNLPLQMKKSFYSADFLIYGFVQSKSEFFENLSKLYSALKMKFSHGEILVEINVAVAAVFVDEIIPQYELVAIIERTLLKSKQTNKIQTCIAADLQNKNMDYCFILKEIPAAIKNEQFFFLYQPQINPFSNMIESVEALIRWEHPEKGIISPGLFIHVAENAGFLNEIMERVIPLGINQMKVWHNKGVFIKKLGVNISPVQFGSKRLEFFLKELLTEKFDSGFLEIEITESTVMSDMVEAISVIKNLSDMGCSIAIDDFGVGYSSLGFLSQIPFDVLKIDQMFVRNASNDEKNMAIIESIVFMAKKLKLKIIAEGIESAEQSLMMKRIGCDLLQGFFYSKPVTSEEIERIYVDNNSNLFKSRGLNTFVL